MFRSAAILVAIMIVAGWPAAGTPFRGDRVVYVARPDFRRGRSVFSLGLGSSVCIAVQRLVVGIVPAAIVGKVDDGIKSRATDLHFHRPHR